MELKLIPRDRRIYLDPKRLKEYNGYYEGRHRIYYEASEGAHSWFRLKKSSDVTDTTFGYTYLTPKYTIRIPEELFNFTGYCLTYDSEYIHILLSK